jgi:hypothetical protein
VKLDAIGVVDLTELIVDGDEVSDSLDALIDLIATLEDNLATPTHILVDPLGWAGFRKLKVGASYNQSLLGAGTTDAVERLLSLPVLVNRAVPDYTGVVVDRNAVVSAVGPVMVATSEHQYFPSDSVALRATWRFGHVVVDIQNALTALPTVGSGNVSVLKRPNVSAFEVWFGGALAAQNVPEIVADYSGLNRGSVDVSTVVEGAVKKPATKKAAKHK